MPARRRLQASNRRASPASQMANTRAEQTASQGPRSLQARPGKRPSPLGGRDRRFAADGATWKPSIRQLVLRECGHAIRVGDEAGLLHLDSLTSRPRRVANLPRNAELAGAFETVIAPGPLMVSRECERAVPRRRRRRRAPAIAQIRARQSSPARTASRHEVGVRPLALCSRAGRAGPCCFRVGRTGGRVSPRRRRGRVGTGSLHHSVQPGA
jgi:hypothetical protein